MTGKLSILNIGGHPKDTVIYAGGTMARHAARGDRVTLLTPTTGLSHHLQAIDEYRDSGDMPDMSALVDDRKRELVEAAGELGVTDVRFLGYDDQIVLPREEIINDIADVIGEVQPNIIVTHWPHDTVPAHSVTTQMTLLAIDAASGETPAQRRLSSSITRTWAFPTTIIDITGPREGQPAIRSPALSPTGGDTGAEAAQLRILSRAHGQGQRPGDSERQNPNDDNRHHRNRPREGQRDEQIPLPAIRRGQPTTAEGG